MAYNQNTRVFGPVSPDFKKISNVTLKKPKEYGLNFPIGNNKTSGGFFRKTSGYETIRNGLTQLLLTQRGERVMLPNFGCDLKKFLFQPLDEDTFEEIKEEISSSIRDYTKDIQVLKLGVFELDKITETGGQALKIVLLVALKEESKNQFEVEVVLE